MTESGKKNTEFNAVCGFPPDQGGTTMVNYSYSPLGLVSCIITEEKKKQNPYVPKEIHVNKDMGVMVVKWVDDTETKVTCDSHDTFSVDVGFCVALAEHVLDGKREFKEKWWKIIRRRIKYH